MKRWGLAVLILVALMLTLGIVRARATPVVPRRSTALFFGDSYTAGAGSSSPPRRWVALVADHYSWAMTNRGYGGTGYVATSGVRGCGLDYCPTYEQAIAATNANPDIVIVSGGRNDGPPTAAYRAAVTSALELARSKWPDARLLVTSPVWDDDPAPGWVVRMRSIVRDAAWDAGADYLDLGEPLAGHPAAIAADGVHPNDAGHRAIANAFTFANNNPALSLLG